MALYSHANITGKPLSSVLKVTSLGDFLKSKLDPVDCALWIDDSSAMKQSRAVQDLQWGALIQPVRGSIETKNETCVISDADDWQVLNQGNVIALRPRTRIVSSLYRRGSRSNALLVTERCNSYCLMCSQPPLERDERGRVDELLATIRLIDRDEKHLGFTGGEPTLLGDDLFRLFEECKQYLPDTDLHVLSNGRRFSDKTFTEATIAAAPRGTLWGIPLYSDAPEIHDYVVQSKGAFVETLQGLWNLAGAGARVELRVVLQKAVIPRIEQLAHFISRNLSFVDHVAWMGLESMGFAKPNWKSIWVDPEEYSAILERAVLKLDQFGIQTSVFNLPLCVLPRALRPFTSRSISDWKNVYLKQCEGCSVKNECGGFFASITPDRLPKNVRPVTDMSDVERGLSNKEDHIHVSV